MTDIAKAIATGETILKAIEELGAVIKAAHATLDAGTGKLRAALDEAKDMRAAIEDEKQREQTELDKKFGGGE